MSVLKSHKQTLVSTTAIESSMYVSLFETNIGWFGMLGGPTGVARIVFGHDLPLDAREALVPSAEWADDRDWSPTLRKLLTEYAAGRAVQFGDVQVFRNRPLTPFQQSVVKIVQAIPRGQTRTYGEVSTLAGSPGAARAVGQVMASNPVPIVIPCHRVVGSAGGLGGFSAVGGVRTKQRMLDLESAPTRVRTIEVPYAPA